MDYSNTFQGQLPPLPHGLSLWRVVTNAAEEYWNQGRLHMAAATTGKIPAEIDWHDGAVLTPHYHRGLAEGDFQKSQILQDWVHLLERPEDDPDGDCRGDPNWILHGQIPQVPQGETLMSIALMAAEFHFTKAKLQLAAAASNARYGTEIGYNVHRVHSKEGHRKLADEHLEIAGALQDWAFSVAVPANWSGDEDDAVQGMKIQSVGVLSETPIHETIPIPGRKDAHPCR